MAKPLEYTKKELRLLQQMYNDYYPFTEIAEVLHKPANAIMQKCRRLGYPKRDPVTVRALGFHGREMLKYGTDHEKIRAALKKRHKEATITKIKERSGKQASAVRMLRINLKTMERNAAIKRARQAGATLNQIGKVVGLTKQRVALIVSPPKGQGHG